MSVRKALADARALFKAKEFAAALAQYEHFFDHALEEEESLYGVRLCEVPTSVGAPAVQG
jgi:hypothetical protein